MDEPRVMYIIQETSTKFSGANYYEAASKYAEAARAHGATVSMKIGTTAVTVLSRICYKATERGTGWQRSDL